MALDSIVVDFARSPSCLCHGQGILANPATAMLTFERSGTPASCRWLSQRHPDSAPGW